MLSRKYSSRTPPVQRSLNFQKTHWASEYHWARPGCCPRLPAGRTELNCQAGSPLIAEGNRPPGSPVHPNALPDRLPYVIQGDPAWQFNSALPAGNLGQQPGLAQWYSLAQWVFWEFNDRWTGGVRLEYFRDNNGYLFYVPFRNVAEAGNPGYYAHGFAGNFWDLTLGLNYRPSRRWVLRPELRYDWFSPNTDVTARPYGRGIGQGIGTSGDRPGPFYAGCAAIFPF